MRRIPEVIGSYAAFCEVRNSFDASGILELESDFVYPTTLLPLLVLMDRTGAKLQTSNASVRGYIDRIAQPGLPPVGSTFIPCVRLPRVRGDGEELVIRLGYLSSSTRLFSNNREAYLYLLSELTGNIYEHASADHAYVMAQYYPAKGLIEASFMDDGVTIQGSLEQGRRNSYLRSDPNAALLDALNGVSAKSDGRRGYGLRTSVSIATALGGEVLIVSGRGAIVAQPGRNLSPYRLREDQALHGTLISVRLSEGDKKINLYDHLE